MSLMLSWTLEERDVSAVVEELFVHWADLDVQSWLTRDRNVPTSHTLKRRCGSDDRVIITPTATPFVYHVEVLLDRKQSNDLLSPKDLVARLCSTVGPTEITRSDVALKDVEGVELTTVKIDEADRHPTQSFWGKIKRFFGQ